MYFSSVRKSSEMSTDLDFWALADMAKQRKAGAHSTLYGRQSSSQISYIVREMFLPFDHISTRIVSPRCQNLKLDSSSMPAYPSVFPVPVLELGMIAVGGEVTQLPVPVLGHRYVTDSISYMRVFRLWAAVRNIHH